MLTLARLIQTLEELELALPAPLFVASDIGAFDSGNLVICRREPDGSYVQVGTVVIEDEYGDETRKGQFAALDENEDPLRMHRD